ncbi:Sodium/hydrogen exchanger [Cylindrobasidium torrendii FP15055 ss-10]|uniref:Sodium/hydrogen exchanger n=1 Tax=Cylindrobasidium torrendii FP15055 ss-10 TaxID=1314674 RepID=A0A0D7BJV1_9AGAR|nr:Sodium/hydrogen exchanger [Cylindrobasidium torrendii FP15055 ss-10]
MSFTLVYEIPEIPILFTFTSYFFLLNIAENIATTVLNAGIIGSLVTGIIYGPEAANILPASAEETFLVVGYIGLLLIVFEAGLTTDMTVLRRNFPLSCMAAFVGIAMPIALSMLLLAVGYHYSSLQAFAAGAALSSTSLGTTLSLLTPETKQTRIGVVILSAALFDDIVGLVIASVIEKLASSAFTWDSVVRPILVSVAFILATYLLAFLPTLIPALKFTKMIAHLWAIVLVLSGYVAGAKYAGTSELLGAYLAGVLVMQLAPTQEAHKDDTTEAGSLPNPLAAFEHYMLPVQQTLLSPLFFASIGAALPMSSLGSVNGSSQVVWRGIVYAVLMFISKLAVGVVVWIWPDSENGRGWMGRSHVQSASAPPISLQPMVPVTSTPMRGAILAGLAMVARGEIALIVAQLGRSILERDGGEAFAVVIWAILVDTVGGALGVGLLLKIWK